MNGIIRAYDAKIDDIDQHDRSMVVKINTASVDRYRTVIDPKGAQLRNYNELGRPVLWEHGKDQRRFTDPIANAMWIKTSGGERPREILAKPRFLTDDFSQQRFEWYRDGVLRGWSVNILPDEGSATPPSKEELRSRPEWEGAALIYRSWDLAEFSGTVVPGNAEALTGDRAAMLLDAVTRGVPIPDEILSFARTMTDSEGGMSKGGATVKPKHKDSDGDEDEDEEDEETEEEETAEKKKMKRALRFVRKKSNGKWGVYSESGKELGEHDSEEGAKNQLAAIEAHKHDKRTAPWIDAAGGVYIVRGVDGGAILTTADEEIARQCLGVMGQTRSFEQAHHAITQEIRTQFAEFKSDITALMDLLINGRV